MPWKSSSRTASRRSRRACAPLPVLLALLPLSVLACAAAGPAGAQELTLSVRREGPLVRAGAAFRWDREEELASTLREGLESRIIFTLRVFEKSPGLLSLLGDRLLAEKSFARNAFYDFLDADYIVEESDGTRTAFPDIPSLLRGYFRVSGAPLIALQPDQRGSCYVAVQVQFDPVRLMPPLTIVSLAGAGGRFTTPWTRTEIPR